ncbi:MAG: hypothetical protein A2017_00445 [Lentisphaerae bacterium GWF2_44_16]|nr:MAG: hypothetical protein A2017_00445 [Lentisphaerae bacterium GWF2_44_16]
MEDQGYLMIEIQLPDSAAIPRTEKVVSMVSKMVKDIPGVADVMSITGYSMLDSGTSSNSALVIVVLDDWEKRKAPHLQQDAILAELDARLSVIPSALIIPFSLPSIPGLGTTGGFEFVLQNIKSDDPQDLAAAMGALIINANKQPELAGVYSTFRANVPQLYLEIDREKVKKLGINLSDVFTSLQASMGSMYINDFNKFGKVYQVRIQAEKDYRRFAQDITKLHVRNSKGDMVPLETILSVQTIFAPRIMKRYNLFSSATITGNTAPGRSSGEAIKIMERLAKETLPDGMSFEWTGMSYQEILAGSKVALIFALSIVFVYLFLVAQYESWTIPFAVIFSVPIAFFGALMALWAAGLDNNIYTQIGFVLLIGLAAKTAILIVEFAMEQHAAGKSIFDSAIFAARLRFRAVCMTAASFILGVIPLVVAMGAGAASRRSLGTAVFGGMLIAGIVGTIVIPAFYMIVQSFTEWACKKR